MGPSCLRSRNSAVGHAGVLGEAPRGEPLRSREADRNVTAVVLGERATSRPIRALSQGRRAENRQPQLVGAVRPRGLVVHEDLISHRQPV